MAGQNGNGGECGGYCAKDAWKNTTRITDAKQWYQEISEIKKQDEEERDDEPLCHGGPPLCHRGPPNATPLSQRGNIITLMRLLDYSKGFW